VQKSSPECYQQASQFEKNKEQADPPKEQTAPAMDDDIVILEARLHETGEQLKQAKKRKAQKDAQDEIDRKFAEIKSSNKKRMKRSSSV